MLVNMFGASPELAEFALIKYACHDAVRVGRCCTHGGFSGAEEIVIGPRKN
jgi:hypothetical protein